MAAPVTLVYPDIVTKIQNLYFDEDTKDITFLFEGSNTVIKAHKFLLEIASLQVFTKMFSGRFKEKDTATIQQIRPEIFEMLIYACYLKPIEIKAMEDAVELYNAALMYEMLDLRNHARFYMYNHVHWHNAIYLYDNVGLFNLDCVRNDCLTVFKKYDYQTLISHLFRDEDISEDAFIAVAECWKGEHVELYHILEVFVELGKLKTYNKAIGTISFLAHSIEDALSAKLLTDDEKCAVIANLQSEEARFTPFIDMPGNLSNKLFVHHREAEARDFAHVIWTALLIACSSNKEYFEFLLKKCVIIGGGFVDEGVYEKAFERVRKGEKMIKSDFEYLFENLKTYINVFEKYEVCYDGDERVRFIEKETFRDGQAELFRYEF